MTAKKVKTATSAEKPAPLKSALKKPKAVIATVDSTTSQAKAAKKSSKRSVDDTESANGVTIDNVGPSAAVKAKKAKTAKIADASEKKETIPAVVKRSSKAKTVEAKTTITSTSTDLVANEQDIAAAPEEGGVEVEDDHTAALLAGFESSEDENEPADEGVALSKVPDVPTSPAVQNQLKAADEDNEKTPGVIYIGRIPHGFYEQQMRAYFCQFGTITKLRLSRNKLTGKSKHYAFVEFASSAVADIVQKTMDKYLMFGHILQVRRVPSEQVRDDLFKGANRRFKPMPRNKLEGTKLRRGAPRDVWEGRVKKETKRRQDKAEKLKELGYDFAMPELKDVGDVPVKAITNTSMIGAEESDGVKLVENTPAAPEEQMEDGAVATNTATVQPEPGSTVAVKEALTKQMPKNSKKVKKQRLAKIVAA